MLSLFRIIKFALQDIVRNFSLSFMTVLILVLMLLSMNTLLMIRVLTGASITAVKSQIDLSIFLSPTATEQQTTDVRAHVAFRPEVLETEFLSRDQALDNFKILHESNPDILASLTELGENPLGSTLIVKARDPLDYEKLLRLWTFRNKRNNCGQDICRYAKSRRADSYHYD